MKKIRKTILTKSFTREHSLFYCYVWNDSDKKGVKRWSGIKLVNDLFIGGGEDKILKVYYDSKDLNDFNGAIKERVNSNPDYFKEVKTEFHKHMKSLLGYFDKTKKIDAIEELEKFYKIFVSWWAPMAVIMNIPDIEGLPKDVQEESLKIRKETEKYANGGDAVFLRFFSKYYPKYEKMKYIITPKEVFNLKNQELTLEEIKEISKRLNGYYVLDGKLGLLKDLNASLDNRNLILEENVEKFIDKSLDYELHQRDYSLLGTSVVAKGLFNENKEFFGSSPNTFFLILKNKIFYHNMSKHDGRNRSKSWLKKNGVRELKQINKEYSKKLKGVNLFYKQDSKNPEEDIKKLHKIFIDFTNMVILGYELPQYMKEEGLDESLKELYDLAFEVRRKYEDVHKRGFLVEEKILAKIEEKYNISKGALSYLTLSEFNEFLKTKELKVDVEKRKKFFILRYDKDENTEEYFDPELWKQFEQEYEGNEIKGTVACKGIIQGRVKIIQKIKDSEDLKKGDILVASMTDPRYVPAMKKAGAIVTDEGGITCHAAIVSRELGVPCIIGTKVATRVLKNGDEVEVDADNGIVRILKKK